MGIRDWWHKPKFIDSEEVGLEREESWLELFYDLVFVVLIAELANQLAGNTTIKGIGIFVFFFFPVWWVWIGGTFYNERFETKGLEHKIFIFIQMLLIMMLATFIRDGLGKSSVGFALSYAAARLFLVLLWLRAGLHISSYWPVARRHSIGFGISIALFISSIFIPPPWRFVMWVIGLSIEFVTPIITMVHARKLPRFEKTKLPRRYGLFTIIVLGEAVVGVVHGTAHSHHFTFMVAATGMLGMALTFGIWWNYFEFVARRAPKAGHWWVFMWAYLHLPLMMGIVATGAGIRNVLASEQGLLSGNVRWLLCGAVALSMIIIGLLELTLRRDEEEPTHPMLSPLLKVAMGIVAVSLAYWGGSLSPIFFLCVLMLLLLVQMIYGSYVWYSRKV
jgi:low temperature requirement protein LtrA